MAARRPTRGFTLVEATITVAIIALVAAVVLPAVSNMTRAELRQSASMLAATVRTAYDNAALGGQTYRLSFSFEKGTITMDATEQALAFDEGQGIFVEAAKGAAELREMILPQGLFGAGAGAEDDDEGEAPAPSALAGLLSMNKLGQQHAASGFTPAGTMQLGDNVRLLDVWTEGMSQPAAEGDVYLYFFPNGYTQDALIHIEDEDNRVFTVKVWSLTGKTEVFDSYVEVPK